MTPSGLAIQLDVSSIVDETLARPLLRFLELLPTFAPHTYDINRKGLARVWDLDHAVVDLLTQRTQFFEVLGEGGTALIATGKHGEPPTLMIEGASVAHFEEKMLGDVPGVAAVAPIS